jgi:hypothetical protein
VATQFESFVNTELPRRPALLTLEITGYDGDPNLGPPILQVAPKGTFYLRNADGALWRKKTVVSNSWVDIGTGGGGGSAVEFFDANCLASDMVGDLVRISGTEAGGLATVTTCDVTNPVTMPAVGIIVGKITTTVCTIQRFGRVSLASIGVANLIPGRRYFVGYNGRPLEVPPSTYASPSGFAMVQVIGVATGTSTLEIRSDLVMTKVYTDAMPPVPTYGPSTSLISATPFLCPIGSAVGDLVYLEAEDEVGVARADSINTMPVFGIIQSKPDASHCYVQFAGEAGGYSGLVPDTDYYVSAVTAGRLSTVAPATSGQVLQKVGAARNTTTIILTVDIMDYFVL